MTKKPPPTPIMPAANLTAHLGKQQQQQQQEKQQQQPQQGQQQPDYSWQIGLQQVWEKHCLVHGHGRHDLLKLPSCEAPKLPNIPGVFGCMSKGA
eukprot:125584-Pelagomonas_calceolata.AAC.1